MSFPKCVYKRGTGKAVDASGLFAAESFVVASEEELRALGDGWCDNPAEAAAAAPKAGAKPETKADEKPAKKAK